MEILFEVCLIGVIKTIVQLLWPKSLFNQHLRDVGSHLRARLGY